MERDNRRSDHEQHPWARHPRERSAEDVCDGQYPHEHCSRHHSHAPEQPNGKSPLSQGVEVREAQLKALYDEDGCFEQFVKEAEAATSGAVRDLEAAARLEYPSWHLQTLRRAG